MVFLMLLFLTETPSFLSKFWKELFRLLGTKLRPSSAYHPETDGQTEIMNKKLEEMIRAFVNHKQENWDEHLIEFEVAYNSSVNATTTYSPFYLTYCENIRTTPVSNLVSRNQMASDFIENIIKGLTEAKKRILNSNEYSPSYVNKKRRPCTLKLGDFVLLSTKNLNLDISANRNKLNIKYCGPFRMIEKINPVTFRLELSKPMLDREIHNAFHAKLLVPYFSDEVFNRNLSPAPPLQFSDGHVEYEVEKILRHRKKGRYTEYLVKWLGNADHENSWVSEKDLANALEQYKTASYPSRN